MTSLLRYLEGKLDAEEKTRFETELKDSPFFAKRIINV